MSRGRVYLVFGVVLAVISAVLVYVTVQGARPKPTPTREVLVAAEAIPPRTFVNADNIKTLFAVASWPVTIVPGGTLTSPTQALNHVIVGTVEKGAPVFGSNISTDQTSGQTGLSIDIPAGDVAVSIPISAVNAAGGAISPGDFIDMLVSVKAPTAPTASGKLATPPAPSGSGDAPANSSDAQLVSLTTLQHVKVLAMGSDITPAGQQPVSGKSAQPAPSGGAAATMTLLLSHQDALLVKYAKDSGGTIDIALRRYDDSATSTTTPVDLNAFLNQFGYHLVAPNTPATPAAPAK